MRRYKSLFAEEYFNKEFYKLLLENKATNYLKQMNTLFSKENMSSDHSFYYKWQAKVAKSVKCISYKDISGLEQQVDIFIKHNKLKIKQCYYNAYKCADFINDVYYVEGVADLIIPINHAWNYYKGYYFDLTAEIALKDDVTSHDYAQVIKLSSKEMHKYAMKSGLAGEYIGPYYIDKIEKKK